MCHKEQCEHSAFLVHIKWCFLSANRAFIIHSITEGKHYIYWIIALFDKPFVSNQGFSFLCRTAKVFSRILSPSGHSIVKQSLNMPPKCPPTPFCHTSLLRRVVCLSEFCLSHTGGQNSVTSLVRFAIRVYIVAVLVINRAYFVWNRKSWVLLIWAEKMRTIYDHFRDQLINKRISHIHAVTLSTLKQLAECSKVKWL